MNRQIIGSVTKYLADLTTKLTNIVKTQNLHSLSHNIFTNTSHPIINPKYKKLDQWNYLQYFDYLLKLDTTHPIRLQKKKQPFTLKEDLEILKAVSSNPNKIIIKTLEELASNKDVYKSNFRNVRIKRDFRQLKERHQFLSTKVKQPELRYLTQWLEVNGLETKAYLRASTDKEFQSKGLRVAVSKSLSQQDGGLIIQLAKGKRANPQKQNESDNENQKFDNFIDKSISKKKVHTQTALIQSFNINRVFQTPPVKISPQSEPPKAPKKIKQQESQQQEEQVKQTPNKQRKIFRVLDVKKDVVIKQESDEQKGGKSQTQHSPMVSEFKLFTDNESSKINQNKTFPKDNKLRSQQSLNQLQAIVQKFKTNQNMSEVRILKILDQVSGDLSDLKLYLKTQDRQLLWKRLQDAILRNYIKNTGKRVPTPGKRQLSVEVLYEKLVKDKGSERVKRRVNYLKLEETKV